MQVGKTKIIGDAVWYDGYKVAVLLPASKTLPPSIRGKFVDRIETASCKVEVPLTRERIVSVGVKVA